MKLKIDTTQLKDFGIRHVEKGVLGLALLLLLLFVWRGYGVDRYEKTPNELDAMVKDAVAHLAKDSSAVIVEQRDPKANYLDDVQKGRTVTSATAYTLTPFNKPVRAQQVKRSDPALYAPISLEALSMTGALAYQPIAGLQDNTLNDANAGAVEKKATASSRRRETLARRRKARGGDDDEGFESDDEDEEYSDDSVSGPSSSSAGGVRTVPADYVVGFRSGNTTIPYGRSFVAIKALVPYEKQWEEYERILGNALGYFPPRDRPNYVFFAVERADVTNYPDPMNDEVKDSDWTPQSKLNPNRAYAAAQQWQGVPNEIVDPLHVDPMLTMPSPPVMFRELDGLLAHSESPLLASLVNANMSTEVAAEQTAEEVLNATPGGDLPLAIPLQQSGLMSGIRRSYSSSGGDDDDDDDDDWNEDDDDDDNGGGGYNYGYGRSSRSGPAQPQIQYKLVRVYDFDVQSGHIYRYRVQLWLEDPNHPKDVRIEPLQPTLDPTVLERLDQVAAEERKNPQAARIFWVKTDWSEPSPPVIVSNPNRVIAGPVSPPRMSKIPNTNLEFQTSEASGTVLPIAWDPFRSVDVTTPYEVRRGSVLNFVAKTAEYAQPVSLVVKAIENFPFNTDLLIADLEGGRELPGGTKDRPITALGEYAVVGPDGRLQIHSELEDENAFRRYSFRPDEPINLGTATSSDSPGSGRSYGAY